jgi:type VI secretion system protein ImpA
MASVDLDTLLADLSPESPCGEDLSYDPAFLELERIAQGTPEQQIGDTIIPAEEPSWREVKDKADELWGRSRDLRVLLYRTLADLKLRGLPGLRDGLVLLHALVERHWENLFPKLDPDDDNDPTERLNIIAALAAPPESFGDPMMFQRRVREAPLTDSRRLGRFGMRDILVARGELTLPVAPDGSSPPDMAVIEGAFDDTATESLEEVSRAATESLEAIKALSTALDERVGLGNAPSLKSFETLLSAIAKEVAAQIAKKTGGALPEEAEGAGGNGVAAPAGGGGGGAPLSGDIRSARDVLLALDKVARYYQQAEISSPVPLFIGAARQLVSKSFVEITRILTPDLVRQVEEIANPGSYSEEES